MGQRLRKITYVIEGRVILILVAKIGPRHDVRQ
jgi:hypothetical protein